MSKIAVVYWSGTGNTEAMANVIADAAACAGAEAKTFTASEFSTGDMAGYDAIAFGCPAMGAEQLEEDEFEPMFSACKSTLKGKKIALFGSYGWGDGQWMRDWVQRANDANANVYTDEGLMAHETPDEAMLTQCREFGKGFATY